ncbi:MAG: type II toxin-antitoxin system YafQ family toxin [Kiritimatiellae bacterium]|nr:type II toxin-antitoxin system YafQ family toxin [Kiritimatiellia bacterium]MCO5062052.1 type II toxin-antitoxin system YafQ family toxin [Kiritimatiellia bacterium]MCO5069255.1 type II toxin-antitoxin system YafQ family toxin [Kiritimatiellia bacterium]
MKQLSQTKQFSKDVKRMSKRGKDLDKLKALVRLLAENKTLDPKHRDHSLIGEWKGSRDCHIEPDWLLIYTTGDMTLRLERTGTHSDLFRK